MSTLITVYFSVPTKLFKENPLPDNGYTYFIRMNSQGNGIGVRIPVHVTVVTPAPITLVLKIYDNEFKNLFALGNFTIHLELELNGVFVQHTTFFSIYGGLPYFSDYVDQAMQNPGVHQSNDFRLGSQNGKPDFIGLVVTMIADSAPPPPPPPPPPQPGEISLTDEFENEKDGRHNIQTVLVKQLNQDQRMLVQLRQPRMFGDHNQKTAGIYGPLTEAQAQEVKKTQQSKEEYVKRVRESMSNDFTKTQYDTYKKQYIDAFEQGDTSKYDSLFYPVERFQDIISYDPRQRLKNDQAYPNSINGQKVIYVGKADQTFDKPWYKLEDGKTWHQYNVGGVDPLLDIYDMFQTAYNIASDTVIGQFTDVVVIKPTPLENSIQRVGDIMLAFQNTFGKNPRLEEFQGDSELAIQKRNQVHLQMLRQFYKVTKNDPVRSNEFYQLLNIVNNVDTSLYTQFMNAIQSAKTGGAVAFASGLMAMAQGMTMMQAPDPIHIQNALAQLVINYPLQPGAIPAVLQNIIFANQMVNGPNPQLNRVNLRAAAQVIQAAGVNIAMPYGIQLAGLLHIGKLMLAAASTAYVGYETYQLFQAHDDDAVQSYAVATVFKALIAPQSPDEWVIHYNLRKYFNENKIIDPHKFKQSEVEHTLDDVDMIRQNSNAILQIMDDLGHAIEETIQPTQLVYTNRGLPKKFTSYLGQMTQAETQQPAFNGLFRYQNTKPLYGEKFTIPTISRNTDDDDDESLQPPKNRRKLTLLPPLQNIPYLKLSKPGGQRHQFQPHWQTKTSYGLSNYETETIQTHNRRQIKYHGKCIPRYKYKDV